MGIIKIPDLLHDEIRQASQVMARSINGQGEFWLRLGMYAERYPAKNYQQLIEHMAAEQAAVPVEAKQRG